MSASLQLQKAIHETLLDNLELINFLGGPRIYDDAPHNLKPPYVLFGAHIAKDWSTDSDAGLEHEVELIIWSLERGRKQATQIADQICQALNTLMMSSTSQTLILFKHASTSTEFVKEDNMFRAKLTFKAITEPLAV